MDKTHYTGRCLIDDGKRKWGGSKVIAKKVRPVIVNAGLRGTGLLKFLWKTHSERTALS
jgi:hypothetical protein